MRKGKQLGVDVTDEERREIKTACAKRGEYISPLARALLLAWARVSDEEARAMLERAGHQTAAQ